MSDWVTALKDFTFPPGWSLTTWEDFKTRMTVFRLSHEGGLWREYRLSELLRMYGTDGGQREVFDWIAATVWPDNNQAVLIAATTVPDQRDLTHSVIRNLAVPKGWSITTWDDDREIVVELRHTGWSGQHRHRLGEEEVLNGSDLAYEKVVAWVTSTVWPGWVPGMEMVGGGGAGGTGTTSSSAGVTFGGGGAGTGQGPVIVSSRPKIMPPVEVAPPAPGVRRIDLDD